MRVLLLFAFFYPLSATGQTNLQSLADTLFAKHAYAKAADIYREINTEDSLTFCENKRKLATCYLKLNDLRNGEETYRILFSACKTTTSEIKELAGLLQKKGEYEKARRLYVNCLQQDTADVFCKESADFCDSVKILFDRINGIYLENMYTLNSAFDDVLDDIINDTIYFLSSRKLEKKGLCITDNLDTTVING